MDYGNKKHEFNSNCAIEINEVLTSDNNDKKKVARRRWAILARALKSPTGSEPASPTDEYSVRRISSFMLLTTQLLDTLPLFTSDPHMLELINKRKWYKYSLTLQSYDYFANVGHRLRTFSAEDLMGFNNTGNICIWPSEETLTYYVMAKLYLFKHKNVLELGGGMSCLAGLMCAKYGFLKSITLTDGNKISVENVESSLYVNEFTCPVYCKVLKWGVPQDDKTQYDIIFCADCLFFDEARIDLIDTLWDLMSPRGLGLVMAPRRGNTLDEFKVQAQQKGFICTEIMNYNSVVWEKHVNLLGTSEYDENIHYPILVEVTKVKVTLV